MRFFINIFFCLIVALMLSCSDKKKETDPAIKEIVDNVCQCYQGIKEDKGTMPYKTAVNSCVVEGMSSVREVENASIVQLLATLKLECPAAHQAYGQL